MPKRLEVLIYLTGGQHWIGGVQYTRNLLEAVSRLPVGERPRLVVRISDQNRGHGYEEEFARLPGVVVDGPVSITRFDRLRHRWFGRVLPHGRLSDRCQVAFPAKGPGIADSQFKIYWIPDFQYKCLPHYFPVEERRRRDEYYARMHKEAKLMVLSSRAVEGDYRHFFPEARSVRVEVLPFTSTLTDAEWSASPEAVAAKHKLPDKFLYAPNQIWQHKGHDTLFSAIHHLRQQGVRIPVVCTGNPADYRNDRYFASLSEFVRNEKMDDQVIFLGLLPRSEQVQLFRQAALVIQASRFEGWSTVVEDTRAVGQDLVLSDLAVHREQAPAHARFFRTGDAADLAEVLCRAWVECRPGVDPARAAVARAENERRTLAFARRFVEIVRLAEEMAAAPSGN